MILVDSFFEFCWVGGGGLSFNILSKHSWLCRVIISLFALTSFWVTWKFNPSFPHTSAVMATHLYLLPQCVCQSVWPDWAIYCTLGNFSKPMATIILSKLPTFLGNFLKQSKSFIFLVKSFLGNFYKNLATFYWLHCSANLGLMTLAYYLLSH